MTPDSVMNLGEQALQVTVLLSAPILLSALAIGFIVAMFQAATQINEQTLSFVPKLLIKSALVIPIPVSRMVRVLFSRSGVISILRSVVLPRRSLF